MARRRGDEMREMRGGASELVGAGGRDGAGGRTRPGRQGRPERRGRRTNKLACLLAVQARGVFGLNRALHGGSRRDRARLGLIVGGVVLVAAAFAVYGWYLATALTQVGAVDAVPVLAVAVASLAGLAVTFLKANGLLFGFRDFDLVMALPVARWQVVLSRVAPLYGMNLAVGLVVMAPMTAVWGAAVGAGAGAYLLAALALLLAPLLPMTLAVGVAWLIALVAARTRRGRVVMGVLALALVAVVVVAALGLSGTAGSAGGAGQAGGGTGELVAIGQMGEALSAAVAGAYPPAAWAAAGLAEGDGAAFLLFAGVSLGAAALVVTVLARWLLPINAALESGGGKARVRAGAYRRRSALAAMVGKEFRLLVATPIYLINTAVGPVLALVLGIACLVASPAELMEALAGASMGGSSLDAAALGGAVVGVLPWAVAFCVLIAPMSASSVSLEGPARWVMQTVPVETRTVVGGKALANFLLCGPAGVVGGVLAGIGCGAGPLQMAAFACAPLAGAALSSSLGVLLDARRPRYDWTTEYEVVKRSFAVMASVFAGFAVVAGGVAVGLLAGAGATAGSLALAIAVTLAAGMLLRAARRIDLRD